MIQKQINQPSAATEQQYVAPAIEIIEIEISQNILGGSAGLPGVGEGGEAW